MDTRVSSAKSLSAIINLNLVKESKEGPISAHNSTMAHEDHAQAESESINLAVTPQFENDRTGSPLNSSASGSRSASRKRHLLSSMVLMDVNRMGSRQAFNADDILELPWNLDRWCNKTILSIGFWRVSVRMQ